jgi:hypothetical protein
MNHRDLGRHNLPHIHVEYQDEEAVFSIPDGQLLAGNLPQRQKRMVFRLDNRACGRTQ